MSFFRGFLNCHCSSIVNEHLHSSLKNPGWYCWWLKSQTTTWDGAETLQIMVDKLPFPQLVIAGFQPSTGDGFFFSSPQVDRNVGVCLVITWVSTLKNWRNPVSPRDNTWNFLGLILSCNGWYLWWTLNVFPIFCWVSQAWLPHCAPISAPQLTTGDLET